MPLSLLGFHLHTCIVSARASPQPQRHHRTGSATSLQLCHAHALCAPLSPLSGGHTAGDGSAANVPKLKLLHHHQVHCSHTTPFSPWTQSLCPTTLRLVYTKPPPHSPSALLLTRLTRLTPSLPRLRVSMAAFDSMDDDVAGVLVRLGPHSSLLQAAVLSAFPPFFPPFFPPQLISSPAAWHLSAS
jgi:hypothetical protein